MAALTASRNTPRQGENAVNETLAYPVKAAVKIFQGGIVCLNASGLAVTGTAALALRVCGMATADADNTSGADSAITVSVRRGTFKLANSSGGDLIAQSNCLQDCYIVDDQTVALTDSAGTRSLAGKIMQVDTDGVWVELGVGIGQAAGADQFAGKSLVTVPITNTGIANGVVGAYTPKFPGKILAAQYVVGAPVTTPAKLSTITPTIAGVSTTGGVISLTSAGMTPRGTEIDGTAVTAANSFTAGQQITLVASATTAFIEGDGYFVITLG